MGPRSMAKKETHRVVCCCTKYKCNLGRHVDAHGVTRNGIEVLPETRAAHQQAEAIERAVFSLPTQNAIPAQEGNSLLHDLENLSLNSTLPREPAPRISSYVQLSRRSPAASLSNTQGAAGPRPNTSSNSRRFSTGPTEAPATQTRVEPDITAQSNTRNTGTRASRDTSSVPSKICAAAAEAKQAGVKVYDCERFYTCTLKDINPLLLHVILVTAILCIFGNLSKTTVTWLLDCLKITVELSLTHGFKIFRDALPLHAFDAAMLRRIPKTITTVIKWLDINPHLVELNCCQACFALYPLDGTPTRCNYEFARIPGGPPDSGDPNTEVDRSAPEHNPDDSEFSEGVCGHALLHHVRGKKKPIRRYAVQQFSSWIAHLMSRCNVENWLDESLEESLKPFNPRAEVGDIHQSKIWKEFKGPDGKQFTARSGNLTFGMFVDAINPYGNKISGKHVSITFVVMVCLTLPIGIRHLPQNIFLVGIAPGPQEPSLEQMNWILRPIVTELKALWNPGLLLSRTHLYKTGRLIRVALLPFIADIPALRRSLGFPSASATNFCSLCCLTRKQINILDQNVWKARTYSQHKIWALQARDSKSVQERKKIFKTHGVRYSVLIELDYWNIIDYHVVDSMHNLLLGLIAWHVRRFWSMKDVKNEEDKLLPISNVELSNLILEHSAPLPANYADITDDTEQESEEGNIFNDLSFGDNTSSDDEDFDPLEDSGWNGRWEAPPLDEIIMDFAALQIINLLLPKINLPSWIKRAIKVLGKASFGKLKADEWRNLFTLQLPLILIPLWFGKDHVKTSLLKNFLHLVSAVNLALKRNITSEQIDRFEHHIKKYLEGCLELFKHCHLAPNHHMALHLAELLRRFGPVRSWWSFPFERLMGSILKAFHNNHLGELEISFLMRFCHTGNLAALLADADLPEALRPYISRLQSLYEPSPPLPKRFSNSNLVPIENKILKMLTKRLNDQESEQIVWMTPEDFCSLPDDEAFGHVAVQPRGTFCNRLMHNNVSYANFTTNPADSIVLFKSGPSGLINFGKIFSIFTHRRSPKPSVNLFDTWMHIQRFPKIPDHLKKFDPFSLAVAPDVQSHLRAWGPPEDCLVRLDELVAHCTWMVYKAGQIHQKLNIITVGLISTER